MAYRMEYGMNTPVICTTKKIRKPQKSNTRKWVALGLIIALIALCTMTDILIPGDVDVTKAAMSQLLSNVRNGEQVVDAFAVFCQTVLQGG